MPKLPSNIWKARPFHPYDYGATDAKDGGTWHIYGEIRGARRVWCAYKPADAVAPPLMAHSLRQMGELLAAP